MKNPLRHQLLNGLASFIAWIQLKEWLRPKQSTCDLLLNGGRDPVVGNLDEATDVARVVFDDIGMDFENEAAKDSCTALLSEMVGGDIRDVRPVGTEHAAGH